MTSYALVEPLKRQHASVSGHVALEKPHGIRNDHLAVYVLLCCTKYFGHLGLLKSLLDPLRAFEEPLRAQTN